MGVQASFIHHGLILSTCIHHRASDALGLVAVLKVWAKNTRMVDAMNGSDVVAAKCKLRDLSRDRAPMRKRLIGAQIRYFPEYRVHKVPKAINPGLAEKVVAPRGSSSASTALSAPLKLCIFHMAATQLS